MPYLHVTQDNLFTSLAAAFQAAISVELTLFYGYAAAASGLLDSHATSKISGLCTRLFLPCLIVVQCGSELSLTDIKELWVIFVWSFVTISFGFLVGWLGHVALKLPGWSVTACAINNANAMPLLLLQSLSSTGALDKLAGYRPGESSENAIARAKTYVLLYMLVQQAYGFAAGPFFLKLDARTGDDEEQPRLRQSDILQDAEHVGLLDDDELGVDVPAADIRSPLVNVDDLLDYKPKYPRAPKLLRKVLEFFNPPLVAAFVAVFIGIIPPLHALFLEPGSSPLYPSVTASLKNLGDLFTSLQMFSLGAQLHLTRAASAQSRVSVSPGWLPSIYVLVVRFVVVPAACISTVYMVARMDPTWLRHDPMLWFIMMVSPSGPSALMLASFAELVKTDEVQIAMFLFVSYLVSPVIAFVVSIALEVISTLQ